MGIMNLFKRAKPLPRIEHPIFGPMEATLADEDGSYFWETRDPIPTSKGTISVFLDGSIHGPSEEQIALWRWIHDNSERLAKSAEPLLLDRLRAFGLEEHICDLVWTAAGLSPDGDKLGPWDMSFELPSGAILTANFENGVPTSVTFDD